MSGLKDLINKKVTFWYDGGVCQSGVEILDVDMPLIKIRWGKVPEWINADKIKRITEIMD